MSNAYINLPCSTGTANGATTAVATLGDKKTMVVTGLTGGVFNVAGTDDGTNFVELLTIDHDGVYYIDAAYASMRCQSKGVTGTVTVDIGSTVNLVVDIDLNVPAGNGNGTAADTSQLGVALSFAVTGTFEAVVTLQGSNDNTNFQDIASFTGPANEEAQGPFSRMRVHISGYKSGTPIVSVGSVLADAVSPDVVGSIDSAGLGVPLVIYKSFAAGVAGTPDDVTIYNASIPFGWRILDALVYVSTNIGGSTLQLRDTAGGGGAALSDAFDSATTGIKRDVLMTATPTQAAGDSLFLRRSDRGVAGEVIIWLVRT
jgi:hypothetical protein